MVDSAKVVGLHTYLGDLSINSYDPNAVSNPYVIYDPPYGNTIKNIYSTPIRLKTPFNIETRACFNVDCFLRCQ